MKKLINLLSLAMLLSVNVLTPISYATENLGETGIIPENGSGMAENGSGMAENGSGSDNVLLGGKEVAPTGSGTEDFYEGDESSKNPQSSDKSESSPLDKGVQSGENLDSSALPQNDGQDGQTPQNDGQTSQSDNQDPQTPQEDNNDGSFIDQAFQLLANSLPLMAPLMANDTDTDTSNVIKNIDYQHEQEGKDPFTYGYISIEDPDNPGHGITIMDRNLGATTTGAGAGADAGSYGYYYQRGNNYGFSASNIQTNTTSNQVDVSEYNPSGYYSSIFIQRSDPYSGSENLWGGGNDEKLNNWGLDDLQNTLIDRQGPCPDGWHVPSVGEYVKIMDYLGVSYYYADDGFYSNTYDTELYSYGLLNFPRVNAYIYNGRDETSYLTVPASPIWTSSRYVDDRYGKNFNTASVFDYHNGYCAYFGDGNSKGFARPIRCFSNAYIPNPSIHFESNGGNDIESQTTNLHKMGTKPADPVREGYFFDGWYEDPDFGGSAFDFSTPISGDITLYAKWKEFGTIAIPYPKDPTKGIILLDHNIGATDLGTGSDLEKKGYYYQWGNNYGFPLADPTATITFSNSKVNVSQYGPSNPYYGNAFIRPAQNWALDNGAFTSKNLRGGGNDSTQNNWGYDKSTMTVIGAEDRQGPCPDGYHVPSAGEWAQLIAFYIGLYNIEHGTDLKIVQENGFNKFEGETEDVINDFINELLIPNSKMYNEKAELDTRAGLYTSLASSSPTLDTNTGKTWSFSVRKKVLNMRDNPRASAQAVRCFANEYVAENQTISFVSDGEEIGSQEVARGFFATKPSDPQKDGYMFAGWYEDPDFSGERFSFRTKIQSDLTLYAKWLEYDIISIQDPADPTRGITIMDRNLLSDRVGTGDRSGTSDGSNGAYYQRGNNYGFNRAWVEDVVSSQMDVSIYGPDHPYYDDVYRYGYHNWTKYHDEFADTNLWGGGNDIEANNWGYDVENNKAIDAENRQGPCPDGWHVPSAGERSQLLEYYVEQYNQDNNTSIVLTKNSGNLNGLENTQAADNLIDSFLNDLLIARYTLLGWEGSYARWDQTSFATSSPIKDNSGFSWRFAIRDHSIELKGLGRANALPVRCFANEFIEPKWTISFESDGAVIDTQQVTRGLTGTQPANPDRKGYTFIGWYDNAGFSGEVFDFENTPIKSDITLYAKWKKNPGWSGRGNSRILNDEGDATHGSADDMTQSLTGKYIIPEDKQAEKWDMHKWAYDNGLTIYKPGEDAKFDKPLTRQQMAKISSVFGTNFLNQKADDSEGKVYECSQYTDLHKSKGEMRGYVVQSCLMKNMGYAYDGVNLIKKFKPYDKLTVAQASVILSRMAWGNTYVISPKMWFEGHMYAAYDYGLIDDISDPNRIITRGEAFMMMYRLSQLMKSEK